MDNQLVQRHGEAFYSFIFVYYVQAEHLFACVYQSVILVFEPRGSTRRWLKEVETFFKARSVIRHFWGFMNLPPLIFHATGSRPCNCHCTCYVSWLVLFICSLRLQLSMQWKQLECRMEL
jgi:hypothetical protein